MFATETFSIGVNMPARTVVFLSLNKPSDSGRRDLYPSEYIQMAGRAGRRGQDESGTVIILSSNEDEINSVENILNGQPFVVKSKFCLTYGMILRMLSKKSGSIIHVEDLMRSSFSEFAGEAKSNFVESTTNKIEQLEHEIKNTEDLSQQCKICCENITDFACFYREFIQYQTEALSMILCNVSVSKDVLETGRICLVKINPDEFTIGVVSEEFENSKLIKTQNQARFIPILLLIGDSSKYKFLKLLKIIDHPVNSDQFPYFVKNSFLKCSNPRAFLVKVHFSNIIFIANEKIKLKWKFLKEPGILDNKEAQ